MNYRSGCWSSPSISRYVERFSLVQNRFHSLLYRTVFIVVAVSYVRTLVLLSIHVNVCGVCYVFCVDYERETIGKGTALERDLSRGRQTSAPPTGVSGVLLVVACLAGVFIGRFCIWSTN